jgi:glycosyltransferase involved in cell wall biosynthesis
MITKKPEILYIESNSIFIQSHLHCVSLVHDPSILYIVRLHDVFPITHPEWFQYRSRTMFKVGFRGAAGRARFVCDSKSTFKDLTQLTSLEEVQGSVAYCPVLIPNNEMCSSCEGCIATEDNLPHIIGISTIEPRKNYLELLNSWRISKAYESTGTCLFLIGGKGWKSRKVRKMITKYGTNIGIRWIKNACDGSVQRLLLDSKIYVSASLSEGFNLSAAEAIMQRVPAIISDNDVHLELYKNHATFYKSGNPEDLAAKIQHHLSGVECFSETSNEGFQLFDYEGQVAELANALIEQTAGRNI